MHTNWKTWSDEKHPNKPSVLTVLSIAVTDLLKFWLCVLIAICSLIHFEKVERWMGTSSEAGSRQVPCMVSKGAVCFSQDNCVTFLVPIQMLHLGFLSITKDFIEDEWQMAISDEKKIWNDDLYLKNIRQNVCPLPLGYIIHILFGKGRMDSVS